MLPIKGNVAIRAKMLDYLIFTLSRDLIVLHQLKRKVCSSIEAILTNCAIRRVPLGARGLYR